MHHSRQDAIDAATRRALDTKPGWHPIMAAREPEPGVWYMVDGAEKCYGVIRIIRTGTEVGYRAVTWAPASADRELIGYYRTLRAAAEAVQARLMTQSYPKSHPRGLSG